MALIVHSMVAYPVYPSQEIAWRQPDYNANKLVKSLKGDQINGFAVIRDVTGTYVRITSQSSEPAYRLFSNWGARRLTELSLGPVVLVPVPSSTCTAFDMVTTPVKMARALRQAMPHGQAAVGQWLRFQEAMQSSRTGGTRNRDVLRDNLRLSEAFAASRVVLIDDVKTTGAHALACADVLRAAGATVEVLICAGTTVWSQHDSPFDLAPEDLEALVEWGDFEL
jgi:hypothetical protein